MADMLDMQLQCVVCMLSLGNGILVTVEAVVSGAAQECSGFTTTLPSPVTKRVRSVISLWL